MTGDRGPLPVTEGMVEAAAKALHFNQYGKHGVPWADIETGDYKDYWRTKARAALNAARTVDPAAQEGIVLLDVDGVVACGRPARSCRPRPGIRDLVDVLTCAGHEVVLWSAGGAEHARAVAARIGIHGAVRRFHAKPDYPMTEEAALAVIGARPVLQVDDDRGERVADWPFMQIEGWYGPDPAAQEVERLREALRKIASEKPDTLSWRHRKAQEIARSALRTTEARAL